MSNFMEKKAQQKLMDIIKAFQEAFHIQDKINRLQDEKNKIYDDFQESQIKINLELLQKINEILSRLDNN